MHSFRKYEANANSVTGTKVIWENLKVEPTFFISITIWSEFLRNQNNGILKKYWPLSL